MRSTTCCPRAVPAPASRPDSARRRAAGSLYRGLARIVLVGAALVSFPALVEARPENPAGTRGILPDTTGAIAEVILHYDPDLYVESIPLFADLFSVLDPRTRVTVLCPSQQGVDDFLVTWGDALAAHGREAAVVNVGRHLSIWARDRFVPRQPSSLMSLSPGILSAPYRAAEQAKLNELATYPLLAANGIIPRPAEPGVRLEGGNVVANRRHVLIGANVFAENDVPLSSGALYSALRRALGREVVVVRDEEGFVPWVHVDMYVTPLDEATMLVGSTALAVDILRESGDGFLVGADVNAFECGPLGSLDGACLSSVVERSLDEVADQIRGLGYRVVRAPVLPDVPADWMLTYNNVVMERREGRRIVLLPVYGVPSLDEAASAIYRNLGFEVRTVDVSGVFRLGGALRCVVNVVQRTRLIQDGDADDWPEGWVDVIDLTLGAPLGDAALQSRADDERGRPIDAEGEELAEPLPPSWDPGRR